MPIPAATRPIIVGVAFAACATFGAKPESLHATGRLHPGKLPPIW